MALFVASATSAPAPALITFTNNSLGMISQAAWSFGDGNAASTLAPVVTNTYATAGVYTVSLAVSGPYGNGSASTFVVVTNAVPVPAFAATPRAGWLPLAVHFTNLSAYATDYIWKFGDGITNHTPTNEVWHTYTLPGSYPVCLTATGPGGASTACSNNFIVATNPPPPIVRFAASPTVGVVPMAVWFTNLTLAATSYNWAFGDGTTLTTTDTTALEHFYTSAGQYSVCLTAIGPSGTTTGCSNNFILVTNPPPNVAAWGDNGSDQSTVPPPATNVTAIAAGAWHNLALMTDGTVLAWGDNSRGQCAVPPTLHDAVAIAAGGYHSLAIRLNGTVVAWGANDYGQINVPAGLTGVMGIAAGTWHSVALRTNGTVVVWGDNSFGQTNPPAGLANVVAVAAGGNHTLALRADGTVAAWGENTDGAGSISGQSMVPYGLTDVVAIGAGDYHSLAVKRDGTVVAWGEDSQGQCDVPLRLTGVVAVAGGGGHSVALQASGTVVTWGADWSGQGDVPPILSGAASIAAGEYHTLALQAANLPPPRLFNPGWNGTQFSALVQTLSGRNYTLEFTASPASTNWVGISTNAGTGTLRWVTDPTATDTQRFYRLRRW